jgi:serine/threonine protein phosphatase PrpC
LSHDHKPDDPEEERRIVSAGGSVVSGRVDGELGLSRALGDFRFKHDHSVLCYDHGRTRSEEMPKNDNGNEELLIRSDQQKVSPLPEIITMNRDSSSDCFLVAACDGIWDVVTNDECSDMIAQIFKEGEDNLGLVAEEVS